MSRLVHRHRQVRSSLNLSENTKTGFGDCLKVLGRMGRHGWPRCLKTGEDCRLAVQINRWYRWHRRLVPAVPRLNLHKRLKGAGISCKFRVSACRRISVESASNQLKLKQLQSCRSPAIVLNYMKPKGLCGKSCMEVSSLSPRPQRRGNNACKAF